MKALVINCGSSSIKYQLYDAENQQVLAKGIVSSIGQRGSHFRHEAGRVMLQREIPVDSYGSGFELILQALLDGDHGALKDLAEIAAVGHRVVHGGESFIASTIIGAEVMEKIEECAPLAPLHNPVNLVGIREAFRLLPHIPHVAVFDTAFHQTMPPRAYHYALPYIYHEQGRIRRYAFHGTSLRYVSQRAAELIHMLPEKMKMVICHLGSGNTIAAISGGKSIDASTGFTPLPGVMMGTRSGDLDPGIIFYLHRQLGLSLDRIDDMLNREGGLLGVSGVSNDMRSVIEHAQQGNKRCRLALDMFSYQAKKYIGAYAAALGGMDALVFTAGIGENSPLIRAKICEDLTFLGVDLDMSANDEVFAREQLISLPASKVKVLVIPTNEELMIALDTVAMVRKAV